MWHATKKTPLTNKWSDPWIYSSLRPVLNLSKSFHSLRCSLRTFDFLSLGFETKCNLLKVKLLARYLSFPRFIFKMRPFMKTAEWNPQFGIPGKQENSRCDVYFHQLRTPKNSNPVTGTLLCLPGCVVWNFLSISEIDGEKPWHKGQNLAPHTRWAPYQW